MMSLQSRRSRRFTVLLVILPLTALVATARSAQTEILSDIREYRISHQKQILHEFSDFLAIPNVASDSVNIRRNAEYLEKMLRARGVAPRILETAGGPPVVYGELPAPGARHTLLIYAHYDGQPVSPEGWRSDPWGAVLREGLPTADSRIVAIDEFDATSGGDWRLYARSTSDDKGAIVAMLCALDAVRAQGIPVSVNLRFLFDGEEESGSPHLPALLTSHPDLFTADAVLFCDGPVHQTRRMQIVFGARGVMDLELTVYGPLRALHSGHYGNWAPNPAVLLAHLLAGLRDVDGKILIPGFYDDVRKATDEDLRAIADAPSADEALRRELGLAWTEGGKTRLEERILLPAMNVRGVRSGNVGAATQNAVPVEATASIDFRLVPDQKPERVRELVENQIRAMGFYLTQAPPSAEERLKYPRIVCAAWGMGYPSHRTPIQHPFSRAVIEATREATGPNLVVLPTLGGSIPMYLFAGPQNRPVVIFPIANHDNYQHGPNENLRLENLWEGIEGFGIVFARLGQHWGR